METKMSKYVKYISSDHFGSPELKGDRWGYCVELLRTCLVTGFNERTDLVNFEVLTPETVKYTFTDIIILCLKSEFGCSFIFLPAFYHKTPGLFSESVVCNKAGKVLYFLVLKTFN